MRILQLCKKFPYPLKDGEAIAVTHLSRALRDLGCEITLLSMNTVKHFTDPSDLPEDFDHYKSIHWVPVDNSVKAVDAFLNLFSVNSYHVERFVSKAFKRKLVEILTGQSFDIIQLETLYLTPYVDIIKKYSDARIVMRAHNIEHEIWERMAHNTSFLPKKWYLSHLTRKLRNYEIDHLNDYDFLIALSERDLRQFKQLGYRNGAMAAPIGIETSSYIRIPADRSSSEFNLCFIGSLDWMPNIEGLNWFLAEVWPLVTKKYPEVTLHIAGRNTPDSLLSLDVPRVVVHGEVPDAAEFITRHNAMVVPLFSGSGMRVKILESMALERPVITTTVGLEGIAASNRKEVLIADTAQEFLSAVGYLVSSPVVCSEMGVSAGNFIRQNFNSLEMAEKLYTQYSSIIQGEYSHQP